MTKIICGGRGCGKTVELIKLSSETGCPIIAMSFPAINHIKRTAAELNIKIPEPIRFEDKAVKLCGSKALNKGILVDDIDCILHNLFYGAPINAATFTIDNEEDFPPEVEWLKNSEYVKGSAKATMDCTVTFV